MLDPQEAIEWLEDIGHVTRAPRPHDDCGTCEVEDLILHLACLSAERETDART